MERNSKNRAYRLEKQLNESIYIENEYSVKRLRFKSYFNVLMPLRFYDAPRRNKNESWKAHRKNQYKNI